MANTATVTGVDVYAWMEPIEGTIPTRYTHHTAARGDVIEVSDAELKRGVDMDALTAGEVSAKAAASSGDADADTIPDGEADVEELADLSAPQLVAWLNQHGEDYPDTVEAVLEAEQARSKPRATVLRAAGAEA